MTAPLREYHFDLGNSTNGPIGMCAVVKATTKAAALQALRKALPSELPVPPPYEDEDEDDPFVQIIYIEVYINPDHVTEADATEYDE